MTQQSTFSSGPMPSDSAQPSATLGRNRYAMILVVVFFLTLPLANPWVRGDGVGYYAYVRSLLVEHKLDFANDWRAGNESFTMGKIHADGTIDRQMYTATGKLDNHWAVGPSILWAPFLAPVHLAMLTLQKAGFNVKPDGFSRPYIIVMALATALYGFLGLYLSFRFASVYAEEGWAFLATLGIWFASSLPVYMYFNPSWSHAHSVFVVALFLWYWQRTRPGRTVTQWTILGLISGLVLDVHYLNVAILMVPLVESLHGYWCAWSATSGGTRAMLRLFGDNLLYSLATVFAFLPTLITREIIYGNPLSFGYEEAGHFEWWSPHLLGALLSSDHGLLSWTPIMILSVAGLFLFLRRNRTLAVYFIVAFVTLCYLNGGNPCWDGVSSFGNRYFISLTPLYVLGLAVTFSDLANWVKDARLALIIVRSMTALLIVWNLAFIFQWGSHMVPARGEISWKQMVRNQFLEVPKRATSYFIAYFSNRRGLMHQIEDVDVRQWKHQQEGANKK